MNLESPAFKEGASIPALYTCDGKDISPPLQWSQAPSEARSFALICDDPDAPMGSWVHWVIYNIPAALRGLNENVPKEVELADASRQGRTDFGQPGYGGPCPPGGTHRYYFRLYALDSLLSLSGKGTKHELVQAMKGHVLAQAQLMGTYKRQ